MVKKGVLFIGRGVAYRKTGPHGLLFIHCRPLLQLPPMTAHPRAPVHPASTALLHWLLFNHPSTVYCSSSPPHHGVLFIHPSTGTLPPSTVYPALHHTTRSCSSRGNIDRLQLAAVAKESLGFSNVASAIARVQLEPNASLGFS